MKPNTVFITGASSGLNRALALAALDDGYRVLGTLRDEDSRIAFTALRPERSFGVLLDVTDSAAVEPLHLVRGSDAIRIVREKLRALSAEPDAGEHVSLSTDFDQVLYGKH